MELKDCILIKPQANLQRFGANTHLIMKLLPRTALSLLYLHGLSL